MADIKVKVGDKVMVIHGARSLAAERTVTAVARVWITLNDRYRFRLDTQTDGSVYGIPPRFYTMEQWAEREREARAAHFLREQGIEIRFGSSWTHVALADLIKGALNGN